MFFLRLRRRRLFEAALPRVRTLQKVARLSFFLKIWKQEAVRPHLSMDFRAIFGYSCSAS
nr:MAG TPA: hypothetical protein [Caudoviricetes sp.]